MLALFISLPLATPVFADTIIDTVAPSVPTSLVANPVSPYQINLNWATSTDNIGVTGYKIYNNNVQIATSTLNSYSNIGLASSATYIYNISAFDAAGNVSATSTSVSAITPVVDLIAPTVPTGLVAVIKASNKVKLTWNVSTDNVAVKGYRVMRNGTVIGTSKNNDYSDATVATSTTYLYSVLAYDAAGNASAPSTALSVTTVASDTVVPTAPTGLVAALKGKNKVKLTWNVSTDNIKVKGYRIMRNGVVIGTSKNRNFEDSLKSLHATTTTYAYSVVSFDKAGNLSAVSNVASITVPGKKVHEKKNNPEEKGKHDGNQGNKNDDYRFGQNSSGCNGNKKK